MELTEGVQLGSLGGIRGLPMCLMEALWNTIQFNIEAGCQLQVGNHAQHRQRTTVSRILLCVRHAGGGTPALAAKAQAVVIPFVA